MSTLAHSWLSISPDSDFSLQNIPLGIVSLSDGDEVAATRLGDVVVDLTELSAEGFLPEDLPIPVEMLDWSPEDARAVRRHLFDLFEEHNPRLRDNPALREAALYQAADCVPQMPVQIPQYVDFYAGINHASNVGRMFRPDMAPLLPNYRHLPVGYNGRASTVMAGAVDIRRPKGQFKPANADEPVFGPTQELDFELELGCILGATNDANPVPTADAESLILGCVLINDWSARDVQRWEYQPLGPFLAKSFATSMTPWIVSWEALTPFLVEGQRQSPEPLPHLRTVGAHHLNLQLEIAIRTPRMSRPQVISRTNAQHLYWSFAQMIAHQTSNGTLVEMGDLYASGTISGPDEGSYGSLLELSWKGTQPITMTETNEQRTFLEDGDTVIMTGYCQGDGYRVGFGELANTVVSS